MKWTSAISENPVLEEAIAECGFSINNSINNRDIDLAVTFISPHYEQSYDRVTDLIASSLGAEHVLGCSGGGVIGNGLEVILLGLPNLGRELGGVDETRRATG